MIETIENRHWDFAKLPKNPLVFDCGALHGDFSKLMADKNVQVVAFDPDDEGFRSIPKHDKITAVHSAVGYPAGTRKFFNYTPGSGANGLYLNKIEAKKNPPTVVEVDVITLEQAVKQYGRPDLLKMNIEGSEIDVIMNSPDDLLQSILQITVSFHGFCGFITKEQEDAAKQRLRDLGFDLYFFQCDILPEDCWAVRRL